MEKNYLEETKNKCKNKKNKNSLRKKNQIFIKNKNYVQVSASHMVRCILDPTMI